MLLHLKRCAVIGDASMAYIPSKALSDVLERSQSGLWIDRLHGGAVALVCKINEAVIKSLHQGAGCSLLFSVVEVESLSIMCLGLRVQDEPDKPFTLMIPNSSPDDLASVKEILGSRTTRLHCLNELNHPVLSASCSLDAVTAQGALDRLRPANLSPITAIAASAREQSDFLQILDRSLRRFQQHIYQTEDIKEGEMTAAIPLTLEIWEPEEVFEISPTAQGGPFRIDDADEGWKLEKEVHLCMDAIYPGRSSIHRPTRNDGKEHIDVLCFDSNSLCLIESKSLSVLKVDQMRPSWRRASNVEKDISKGIGELQGALRYIRSGGQVFDVDSSPILINSQGDLPAHAIVLLSEMYASLDWEQIARQVISASENEHHKALFHVVDLMELNHIVSQSRDSQDFYFLLAQRWGNVKVKGTAYFRSMRLSADWHPA